MSLTVLHNCRVLRNHKLVHEEVWIKGGQIIRPPQGIVDDNNISKIDCRNKIVTPGFIDLQINGYCGVDFSTSPRLPEALARVSKCLPSSGVTAYVPTLITAYPKEYHKRFPLIKYDPGNKDKGATVIGIHCEGPFISKEKRGCHPPECIVKFDENDPIKSLEDMYGDITNLRIITLAPEQSKGAMKVIEELTRRGVIVSLGHSVTDLETAKQAVRHGARKITHLFNAMPGFHHRDPSLPGLLCTPELDNDASVGYKNVLLELIQNDENHKNRKMETEGGGGVLLFSRTDDASKRTADDKSLIPLSPSHALGSPVSPSRSDISSYCPADIYFGVIADGLHTHPAALRIIYQLNRQGLCLVTDAIQPALLPDGEYKLGLTDVVVKGEPRKATMKDSEDTLAGAVATFDFCLQFFQRVTKCPIEYALECASLHPARCLRIDKLKGHLGFGADADFVILDDELTVHQTWINGELTFDRETHQTITYELEV